MLSMHGHLMYNTGNYVTIHVILNGGLQLKKRLISVLLTIILVITILPLTTLAAASLSNFEEINTYHNGQFVDVPSSQWYAQYVEISYEYGLIDGKSSTTFEPDSNLTIAEAIKLAACLHSIFYTGEADFAKVSPWYQTYVDYALENGIISSPYTNYNANATRSDFALIFANALPAEAMATRNDVNEGEIPDVSMAFSFGAAVYQLYNAGILVGSDSQGTFYPNNTIKRSEVATIVTRMANADYRETVSLTAQTLTATEVYSLCSPAVFYIELYDRYGNYYASGSGFFINNTGLAVTNYHVIEDAYSAVIFTKSGASYQVAGYCDYDRNNDVALIQINGTGFPYLTIGDSRSLLSGSQVYAIGSPLGLDDTFSDGIIAKPVRRINGTDYIQMTAPISPGSSGGALLNDKGQVIGITAAYLGDGQNINLAVPIHYLENLSSDRSFPLSYLLY